MFKKKEPANCGLLIFENQRLGRLISNNLFEEILKEFLYPFNGRMVSIKQPFFESIADTSA